jgi:4-amino-4-deoxy-L-arabinose transferase-like glycosyltransferase
MDTKTASRRKIVTLRIILTLAFIEGLVVFWNYLTAPSEAESVVFLQYSTLRLILLLVVLFLSVAILFLLVASFKSNWLDQKLGTFIESLWNEAEIFWFLLVLGGLTYFLLFTSPQNLGSFASYRERLYPMLVWFALIALQSIVGYIYLKGIGSGFLQLYRSSLFPSGIALLLLACLVAFIALTKIGLSPDAIYWQGAGVPLLISQVILAWIIGLLFNILVVRFGGTNRSRVNVFACIALWTLAVLLWWSQPARTSYNVLEPAPPNFQEYPFGDAILYDTAAHEFLTGTALPNDFWVKPLYSFFLAFLHIIAGENYKWLVFLQIAILAIIPVLVYLLVSLIGNRTAGIVASLFVILREQNSIALSNVIQVAHLKLLLSDVFSMGLVVLLLWLMFRWFEKPNERRNTLLTLGGALGLLTLTRGHPILLLPIIFVVIFMFTAKNLRQRFVRAGLFVAGVALVLLPWFLRIYQTTGRFGLQSPVSPYSANLAGLYNLTPHLADPSAFTTDVSSQTLEESDAQNKQVTEFVLQHPDEVLRFVSAHFFHNVIYTYIYLPQSFRIESLRAYVTTEPFWGAWHGELSSQGWILLVANLGLIALGFGTAWKKHKYLALAPLLIGMGYTASVSVGRISGWRFILPADWITLLYFSIGLVQFSYIVWFVVTRSMQDVSIKNESQTQEKTSSHWMNATTIAVFLLLIGSAVTYGNRLFSNRYPPQSVQQLMDEYSVAAESLGQRFAEDELERFLQNDKAVIVYGQAIYPYYLKSDSGPINHAWPAYKPRPYNRVVFYLVGAKSSNVILPLPSHDFDFPDGADVIVLGCLNDSRDVDALSILLTGESPSLFTREPMPGLTCPLPEPN